MGLVTANEAQGPQMICLHEVRETRILQLDGKAGVLAFAECTFGAARRIGLLGNCMFF